MAANLQEVVRAGQQVILSPHGSIEIEPSASNRTPNHPHGRRSGQCDSASKSSCMSDPFACPTGWLSPVDTHDPSH